MYKLIYLSSACEIFTEDLLIGMLKKANSYNLKNDISGVLLYIDGDFLQVLEGKQDDVLNLFEKIKKDKRHKSLICVFQKEVKKRQFEKWNMGFGHFTYKELNNYKLFNQIISKKNLMNIEDKVAITFLETFVNSHHFQIDEWK